MQCCREKILGWDAILQCDKSLPFISWVILSIRGRYTALYHAVGLWVCGWDIHPVLLLSGCSWHAGQMSNSAAICFPHSYPFIPTDCLDQKVCKPGLTGLKGETPLADSHACGLLSSFWVSIAASHQAILLFCLLQIHKTLKSSELWHYDNNEIIVTLSLTSLLRSHAKGC